MKVLTIGSAGQHAGLVVPALKQRGVRVRALVRDEKDAAVARQRGADETVLGDLRDAASLRAAAEGMDGVFHLNPGFAPHEADLGVAMVGAAKAAGVRKFVFSSVIHPSLSLINHAGKRPVEEALYNSKLDFTVLQPTMFMQNFADGWADTLRQGKLVLPYSKLVKVSYVDYRDVAEAAALALTGDALSYGTFELCAPGMVDRIEIAALLSAALGRAIEAGEIPPAETAEALNLPPGPVRDGMTAMHVAYDKYGFTGGNALVLRAILGREPRTLLAYFQERAAELPPALPGT